MTSEKLLEGIKVVVTRPLDQSQRMLDELTCRGATAIHIPSIVVEFKKHLGELSAALGKLANFDWLVFTSANGVEAARQALAHVALPTELITNRKLAAIGNATGAALAKHFRAPDIIPEQFLAAALPDAMEPVAGRSFLLARADIAEKKLPLELKRRGAHVTEVVAYSIVSNTDPALVAKLSEHAESPQLITFTSPSTVRGFLSLLKQSQRLDWMGTSALACIGPVTADELKRLGFEAQIIADEYSGEGLIESIEKWASDGRLSQSTQHP